MLWNRGKVVEQCEAGLEDGKKKLEEELREKLAVILRGVFREIDQVFQEFFDHINIREDELRL